MSTYEMTSSMEMIFSESIVRWIMDLNPNISAVNLVSTSEKSYGLAHSIIVQDMLGDSRGDIPKTMDEVKKCSRLWNISFAAAALNIALQNDIGLNERGVQALMRHNEMSVTSSIRPLEWASFCNRATLDNQSGSMVALSSSVEMSNGDSAHIPMLDLGCENNESGFRSAVMALKALATPGFLLNSGKSFHFYVKAVLSSKEFISFLGRAALLAPIIDAPWIAHQLIEGAAALRLSAKEAYPHRPYLVCEL